MKIVVGVDGSDTSKRAVAWCAQHAGALGAEVVAVYALEVPGGFKEMVLGSTSHHLVHHITRPLVIVP